MAKTTKKIALNANKIAPDAILEQESKEPMVMVTSAQLDALIAQNKEYKQKLADVTEDITKVATTFQKMFEDLGIKKETSKMVMFTKMTKFAKKILVDEEYPEWMNKSLLELFYKYTPLIPNKKENQISS